MEVMIMSNKETRVLRTQDTPNYENRSIAKPKTTTSVKPAPTPKPKTKK
jgi:hypothetical protein